MTTTNELEQNIICLYAKGTSTRDMQFTLHDWYGVEVSAATISTVTDKVWSLVESWQHRSLATVYPSIFLDAIHLPLRRENNVMTTAVYMVLGVDLEGQRDVLGHGVGDGAEGANFWVNVLTDLEARGGEDSFITCIDGLTGFKQASQSVFPKTQISRCVIHQVRQSLTYIASKDRTTFVADVKAISGAPMREAAETRLLQLGERWGEKYAVAVRSWETYWQELATMFDYSPPLRRVISTTNTVEGSNRQLRKVTRNKSSCPSAEAARKLRYLVNRDSTGKWTVPMFNWTQLLNQLAIRFEGRFPM